MSRKDWLSEPAFWKRIQVWAVVVFSAAIPIAKSPAEAAAVIGLIAWIVRLCIERRTPKPAGGIINMLLLAWLGLAALSCLNSIDLVASVNGLRKLLKVFAIYLLVIDTVDSRENLGRVLAGGITGLTLTVVDAGWQAIFGRDLFYGIVAGYYGDGRRISGPFGHPGDLSIHLITVCPVVLALALAGNPKWRKPLFALAIGTAVIQVLSLTRGGIIGFVASMILLSVWLRNWVPAWIALVAGAVQAATIPASVREFAAAEPTWLHKLTQPGRLQYWQAALGMIAAHPWIGVGVNTFVKAYETYRVPGDDLGPGLGPYAHNQYLHIAAEIGLIGLVVFLILLVQLGLAVKRQLARRPVAEERAVAAGLGAGLVAYLIYGLLESSLFYGKGSLLFWWLAGLIIAFDALGRRLSPKRR